MSLARTNTPASARRRRVTHPRAHTHKTKKPNNQQVGVYGFDPLRLGTNKENLKWFREAELTNGRWAMAAVAGILFTDLVGLPKFWEAGAQVCFVCFFVAVCCVILIKAHKTGLDHARPTLTNTKTPPKNKTQKTN